MASIHFTLFDDIVTLYLSIVIIISQYLRPGLSLQFYSLNINLYATVLFKKIMPFTFRITLLRLQNMYN